MKINSITEFLQAGDSQLRVFDMGRRISLIENKTFLSVETAETAYPYPLQGAAWIALLHWPTQAPDSHSIWFLRLPLDEDGLLVQESRDNFLFMLLESLGSEQQTAQTEVHNPYAFTPKQQRMAMFHAISLKQLGLPASSFYQHARDYFAGQVGFDQWAFVGIQGIADLVSRLDEADNAELLAAALGQIPARPLDAVCQCLENQRLPAHLADALIQRCRQELNAEEPDHLLIAALTRSLAGLEDKSMAIKLLGEILTSPAATQPEILACISARCWESLADTPLRQTFLERLTENTGGQEIFNHICTDCLRLPDIGPLFQQDFRNPERSASLSRAIGGLFASLAEE